MSLAMVLLSPGRRLAVALGAVVLTLALPALAAAAPILNIINVQSVTVPDGSSGHFDVTLILPPGLSISNLASFSLELSVPSGSGIQFTNALTSEQAGESNYVFDSFAFTDPPFSVPFSSTTFPATTLDAGDSSQNPLGVSFGPGPLTLGLAQIAFTVAPGTATSGPVVVPVTLSTDGSTSLSDPSGFSIAFTPVNGTITVTPAQQGVGVPEPSTLALLALGGAALAARRWRRRPIGRGVARVWPRSGGERLS